MRTILVAVVFVVSLILWGKIGWTIACKLADSTAWRVILAVPLVAIFMKAGMAAALRIFPSQDQ